LTLVLIASILSCLLVLPPADAARLPHQFLNNQTQTMKKQQYQPQNTDKINNNINLKMIKSTKQINQK